MPNKAGGVVTPILESGGMLAMVLRGTKVVSNTWFGPGLPLQTQGPPDLKARQFDYPYTYNQQVSTKRLEGVTHQQLRALADGYDLLRIIIETRKDQVAKIPYAFRVKQKPGESRAKSDLAGLNDPRIAALGAFFECPDMTHSWQDWLRMLLEEMFVLDALTISPRRTLDGSICALDILDGSTIDPKIDEQGRRPLPPDPAYQQILHGIAAQNFTTDDLIYRPRNVRAHRIYGYSPVEQILVSVNIALRRQMSQLSYYTAGNIPEMIVSVPEKWTATDIAAAQTLFDSMAGDQDARRTVRFIPKAEHILQTKEALLKDEFDEWLARVCCYAMSVSPTAFTKAVNRATAQVAAETAIEEGLLPLLLWIQELVNYIIARHFKIPDIEFQWQDEAESDPLKQAQADQIYIANGKMSIDEVRIRDGQEPIGMGHMVLTASGPVMLAPFCEGIVTGVASIDSPTPEPDPAQQQSQVTDGPPEPAAKLVKKKYRY